MEGTRIVKPRTTKKLTSQERRRQEALARQKQARRDLQTHGRTLVEGGGGDSVGSIGHDGGASGGGGIGGAGMRGATNATTDLAHTPTASGPPIDAMDEATAAPAPAKSKQWKAARRAEYMREKAKFWANQVTSPEWMLDAPEGLNGKGSTVGAGWYVRARPEGKRCLVVASKGSTVSRQLAGGVLHKWASPLPHGSRETNARQGRGKQKEDSYSILDCIYDDHKKTYWVLDAMVWKGYSLYDCAADFRLYWLRTKLEEEAPLAAEATPYKVRLAPYHECDPTGLQAAYAAPVPFIRDGLLFYLKGGHYQLGNTPLVLVWKDRHSSRYLVYSEEQTVVLAVHDPVAHAATEAAEELSGDTGGGMKQGGGMDCDAMVTPVGGGLEAATAAVVSAAESTAAAEDDTLLLVTGEGTEVGQLPRTFAQEHNLTHGELLRFVIDGAAEDAASNTPVLFNPRFDKRCSPSRGLADNWSKILFQCRARVSPEIEPTFAAIAANAGAGEGAGLAVGLGAAAGAGLDVAPAAGATMPFSATPSADNTNASVVFAATAAPVLAPPSGGLQAPMPPPAQPLPAFAASALGAQAQAAGQPFAFVPPR